ncbi:hypothetical protein Patl1_31956 [Pistacia atlantica]|uniref:Uncharacterized protein n=1 Tax=Pistacia atlantica TaxID=434234 RepID=A0ACC1ANX5_9ROSI|nr:hypothetical protein Patl1_31956 [Pistacia atlantica]
MNDEGKERDLERGPSLPALSRVHSELPASPYSPRASTTPRGALVMSNSGKALLVSNSSKRLLASQSSKSLVVSNSGKRFDQKTKYVRQVTGRHNDTELHLAAQRGDLEGVKKILDEIDAQMMGTFGEADFDAEVGEIKAAIVNEVNDLGETALFIAAEKGHLDVVKELLQYTTEEAILLKNHSGFDPLHIAASQGHEAIVQVLLDYDPSLIKTVGQSNATPLISAATKGHAAVVNVLLSRDLSLLEIPKSNGKNALHLAARQGHVGIVKALLDKDLLLARRTDKKSQTALHMAVKGVNREVVRLILAADATIVMLPDKFGNTALHIAARKKRVESLAVYLHWSHTHQIEPSYGTVISEALIRCFRIELDAHISSKIVNELIQLPETDVNVLTRDRRTAIDIVEGLPLSEETAEIKDSLARYGGVRAKELNQLPRDELRKTVTAIKKDVHSQLEQARKTNRNVTGIAQDLRRLHRLGLYSTTNSVTVVAVLFASVAFAAIFTLPGGDRDDGSAAGVGSASFKIFFIFNAIALFTSLSVVVVQITIVRGELKSEKQVVKVINKLMWLASVCTTVSFLAASFIVLGQRNMWAAILVTCIGGVIIAGVLIALIYHILKRKRKRKVRKREKKRSNAWRHLDTDSEVPIYAI